MEKNIFEWINEAKSAYYMQQFEKDIMQNLVKYQLCSFSQKLISPNDPIFH